MKKLSANRYLWSILLLAAGIFLGWLFFHTPHAHEKAAVEQQPGSQTIWTCSMHPQVRMDHPGKCPICGMNLIPLDRGGAVADPGAIRLTREAAQLANVLTTTVSRANAMKEIRLYGKVQADERMLQSQVSHVSGRIEQLTVNYTGEAIRKGQPLALVYSPELVKAQQELLEASEIKEAQPAIYQAARERLLQWKLTAKQLDEIERSGKLQTNVEVVSNSSGIITSRMVNTGDYVSQGTVLFEVADLSKVWIVFDAYESDIGFLKVGDKVDFTLRAMPGTEFSARITFIDPLIDPVTRVARVRAEMNNAAGQLKPEMFVTGIVKSDISASRDELIIPRSAVLWTGKRSIVYVKEPGSEEPVFRLREVLLGPLLGDNYIIEEGLAEGEEIVTQGAFSVDAAAQLAGKPSMMNPAGGDTARMPEHHH